MVGNQRVGRCGSTTPLLMEIAEAFINHATSFAFRGRSLAPKWSLNVVVTLALFDDGGSLEGLQG